MRVAPDRARRMALAVLACALLGSQPVTAQDPRAAQAQRVAREWLALATQAEPATLEGGDLDLRTAG